MRKKKSIIAVQCFQKNHNSRVHRSVGNSASLAVGPRAGIFLSPLNTNDGLFGTQLYTASNLGLDCLLAERSLNKKTKKQKKAKHTTQHPKN